VQILEATACQARIAADDSDGAGEPRCVGYRWSSPRTVPSTAKRSAFVFGTTTGKREGATNVRRRVLAKAVERANEQLAKHGQEQLPAKLTPHDLRRTFASLLFALGETPPYVMGQMGHTTANLTLSIYARQMDRRDGEPERLKALVEGRDWVATGSTSTESAPEGAAAVAENGANGQ
jgi:integrase